MLFSFHLSVLVIVLLDAGLVSGSVYVAWQWSRACRLCRFVGQDQERRDYADSLPAVSVIVDACTETGQLTQLLPLVLEQDYPEFEVVVVANSSAEATSDTLSELTARYPNLHVTFAPGRTRSLSRKKLALMIGIKAARHDIVLTTCANCCASSSQMLRLVMRNFTPEVDIVLAYAHYDYALDRRLGRRVRVFDTVSTGAQWLLAAIRGHAYRGATECLAYRKRLFDDNRGFARSMELLWGEDDVFLSQIARGRTVRVELSPDSQLSVRYDNLRHAHPLLKMRRDFTSRLVRRRSFLVQGLMSCLWWTSLLSLVAAVVAGWPNVVVAAVAGGVLLLCWGLSSWAFARISTVLQAPRLWLSAPLLALWRPLLNGLYRVRESRQRNSNYTSYL